MIHYDVKPVEIKSLVSGVMTRVFQDFEVMIKGNGTAIYGKSDLVVKRRERNKKIYIKWVKFC